MTGQIIGYARTSTADQEAGFAAQLRDLENAGATKIFREKLSGTKKDRPQLISAIDFIREGDVLLVTKLDRLARSTAHLLEIVEQIKSKGVALKFLSNPELNTDSANGKLMLTVLGAIAEFERELMLERQREGIAKAQAEGKYKGRPSSIDREAVIGRLEKGDSPTVIAREMGIGRDSVYRIKREVAA